MGIQMKTILLAFAVIGTFAHSGQAQGTLNFKNLAGSVFRAPLYGPEPALPGLLKTGQSSDGIPLGTQVYGGPLIAGTGYSVTFYAAAGQNVTDLALFQLPTSATAGTVITTFRTGSLAGFFPNTTVLYDNVPK